MAKIVKVNPAMEVMEGAGVAVNRVFSNRDTKEYDPFLMLDYFDSPANANSPGFPWHPHKGIETITYFLRGSGKHEDSMGNSGVISAGELQWMSAGRGIYHQEMPVAGSDGMQGFQFWVNMAAKDKLNEPTYSYIRRGEMPIYTNDGVEVRVISGEYKGLRGPIHKAEQGIRMMHFLLEKGSSIRLERVVGKQGFLVLFEGVGTVNEIGVSPVTSYVLDPGEYTLEASENMQCIFAEGIPLKEPIAWHGPVVMNTQEQLYETFRDLQNGTFVEGQERFR